MQYIVNEKGYYKRLTLYKYIHNNYDVKDKMSILYMLKSKFPFVIDTDEKILWVCESITCLSCASQNNRIISSEQFKIIK